ncbi:MAG: hypothetical protein OSB67_08935 [Alphaproteobacteria bacterium]|nr:hypothetical protein [Alphaproteobacteria bacterium]
MNTAIPNRSRGNTKTGGHTRIWNSVGKKIRQISLEQLVKTLISITGCFFLSASLTVFSTVKAAVWTEDTFDDFADGMLDASGQNLYVSHDGTVRSIGRFDLNDDGWIESNRNN